MQRKNRKCSIVCIKLKIYNIKKTVICHPMCTVISIFIRLRSLIRWGGGIEDIRLITPIYKSVQSRNPHALLSGVRLPRSRLRRLRRKSH